jgi:uncharacterized protein (TIGR00251 family)
MLDLREADGAVSFPVRVAPRASRDGLAGERAGALVVRLKAPPVEGAANAALLRFLAESLDVPASAVEIVHGASHRRKLVRVRGVRAAQVRALADKR